jgi:hypothetical protein
MIRDSWLCLRLYGAELSVPLGAGFSLFSILNIEYRTRNFEQQKFLKGIKTMFFTSIFCGSLFCGSAVHIFNDLIADSLLLSADRGDWIRWFCCSFQEGRSKPGPLVSFVNLVV